MTTQRAKVDLPDLNLWLALAWSCHRRNATPIQAAFLLQPGVRLIDDSAASWPAFHQLLERDIWPARLCPDVPLAALALAADLAPGELRSEHRRI